ETQGFCGNYVVRCVKYGKRVESVSRETACSCDFQTGYRLNGVQEVAGSNPVAPTTRRGRSRKMNVPLFLPPAKCNGPACHRVTSARVSWRTSTLESAEQGDFIFSMSVPCQSRRLATNPCSSLGCLGHSRQSTSPKARCSRCSAGISRPAPEWSRNQHP